MLSCALEKGFVDNLAGLKVVVVVVALSPRVLLQLRASSSPSPSPSSQKSTRPSVATRPPPNARISFHQRSLPLAAPLFPFRVYNTNIRPILLSAHPPSPIRVDTGHFQNPTNLASLAWNESPRAIA